MELSVFVGILSSKNGLSPWEIGNIFSVHTLILFKTSGIFVQTVGIGIPLGEQKTQQMSGDTLYPYTPEKAVLLLGYWKSMKKNS